MKINVIKYKKVKSTNDTALKLIKKNITNPTLVTTEKQTNGRGTVGKKWVSEKGNLFISLFFKFDKKKINFKQFAILNAFLLRKVLSKTIPKKIKIKWPNDLLFEGRKIVGILMELSAEVDHIHHVIIGIGMDVNQTASEFPTSIRDVATSLKLASGNDINRAKLAVSVMQELDADYHRVQSGQFKYVADEWAAQCNTIGREVNIQIGAHCHVGRAEALDESGALLLRTPHGRIERITGGDVTLAQ